MDAPGLRNKILTQVKILFCILWLGCFGGLLLLTLVFCSLLRVSVWLLSRVFRPDLDSLVTGIQSAYAVQSSPSASMNILTVVTVDGRLNVEEEGQDFEASILTSSHNLKFYGKLRKTWESYLGYAFWKEDLNFDIKNHVREYDYGGALLGLPAQFQASDIHGLYGDLLSEPWDRRKSPWEILFISFDDGSKPRTMLVIRFDHVLFDAYSLMELVRKYTGSEIRIPKFKLADRRWSLKEKIHFLLRVPYDAGKNLLVQWESSKLGDCKTEAVGARKLVSSVSSKVSSEDIKRVKNHFGVHYAAVLYYAFFGAIERAKRSAGQEPAEDLGISFVLPRPNHPGGMVVHATFGAISLELNSNDSPAKRLVQLHEKMLSMVDSSVPFLTSLVFESSGVLPMKLRDRLTNFVISWGPSIGTTLLPVTSEPDYLKGFEILEVDVAVSTWSKFCMFVCTGGVTNQQRVTVCTNTSVFPTHFSRKLGLYFDQELQGLINVMDSTASPRN